MRKRNGMYMTLRMEEGGGSEPINPASIILACNRFFDSRGMRGDEELKRGEKARNARKRKAA